MDENKKSLVSCATITSSFPFFARITIYLFFSPFLAHPLSGGEMHLRVIKLIAHVVHYALGKSIPFTTRDADRSPTR